MGFVHKIPGHLKPEITLDSLTDQARTSGVNMKITVQGGIPMIAPEMRGPMTCVVGAPFFKLRSGNENGESLPSSLISPRSFRSY